MSALQVRGQRSYVKPPLLPSNSPPPPPYQVIGHSSCDDDVWAVDKESGQEQHETVEHQGDVAQIAQHKQLNKQRERGGREGEREREGGGEGEREREGGRERESS